MKTTSKFIALAFVLMMVIMPFVAAEESSAVKIDGNIKITSSFDDMNGGTIEVKITDCEIDHKYIVKVRDTENEKSYEYTSEKFTANNSTMTVSLHWNFGSSGHKTVYVHLCDENGVLLQTEGGIGIDVSHSIWRDWTTYAAIILVVILIIVAVYLKMRGLPGSGKSITKKNKKTFTEMEAERLEREKAGEKKMFFSKNREEKALINEQPQQPAAHDMTSTEKQTYSPGRGFFKKRNQ